jgi:hypothetical protein
MIIEIPSHGITQRPDDEQKRLTIPPHKPKATFNWPPDCLWPFTDRATEKDTQ